MSVRVEVICLLNLLLIGMLPRLLFRRGRMNLQWWLTAGPLLVAAATMIAALAGQVSARVTAVAPGGALLAMASMLLIAYTLGTHPRRISMWHQTDQQSLELVTWGPYALIRHPLYTAFQMTLLACTLAVPHVLTAAAFGLGVLQFRRTAILEEQRLLQSHLGAAYAQYARLTGRFLPGL